MSIHFDSAKGEYGEFSNFYETKYPILYQNKNFPTSEHYFQYRKYVYVGAPKINKEYAELIRTAKTPNMARCLGQEAVRSNYSWAQELRKTIKEYQEDGIAINPNWEKLKVDIMREALMEKFLQDQHCHDLLLSTCGKTLHEHNDRDKFWADAGKDMLGILLEEVRKELYDD